MAQGDHTAQMGQWEHELPGSAGLGTMPVLLDEEIPTLDLVSFDAAALAGEGVRVRWATLSEAPAERFMVERSADRLTWHIAAIVDGAGDTGEYTTYELLDEAPFVGISYYRLCTEQPDGSLTEVSDLFGVRHESGQDLLIQPDMIPGRFTVLANGRISDVRLLNNRGQFVPMQLEVDGERVRVNAEQLPGGTYYVQVTVDGQARMRPVTISGGMVLGG
jgi:hypothetical protein